VHSAVYNVGCGATYNRVEAMIEIAKTIFLWIALVAAGVGIGVIPTLYFTRAGVSALTGQLSAVTNNLQQTELALSNAQKRAEQLEKQLVTIKAGIIDSTIRISNSIGTVDRIGIDINGASDSADQCTKFIEQFAECLSNLQREGRERD